MAISLLGAATCQHTEPAAVSPPRVLVMTKTAGFRHDSIPAGLEAVRAIGRDHGFVVDATEDAAEFRRENLDRYAVVVFLNTTGDILDDTQQAALEAFVRGGGGFVGIHAAADTEYGWPWYGQLVGARFDGHGPVVTAVVSVVGDTHPSTRHLPSAWSRRDEWYRYRESAAGLKVVLEVMPPEEAPRAIAWCREYDGGRSWYTGGGHTIESYRDPLFVEHLAGGITWACSRTLAVEASGGPEGRTERSTSSKPTARGTGPGRSPASADR